jgi:D-alanine-D-alanine ligase
VNEGRIDSSAATGPFRRVAVLLGGFSAEREISLRSGKAVANALRAAGYEVDEVDITSRTWTVPTGVEAVFVALHGEYGEDGQIQRELTARGIPFTGSGVDASQLAFDKRATKECLLAAGLPTPAYDLYAPAQPRRMPLPVVVKPSRQGSSVGIHRVFEEAAWLPAVQDAVQYDVCVLVEAYIEGRELTVGVVGDAALPVLEICAPEGNYDYRAKYTSGVTEYRVPAPIDAAHAARCQELALATFRVIGCKDYARVDFRMNSGGELYILEVNTIPGFTATSLLPKAAAAVGLDFPALCDKIMRGAAVP